MRASVGAKLAVNALLPTSRTVPAKSDPTTLSLYVIVPAIECVSVAFNCPASNPVGTYVIGDKADHANVAVAFWMVKFSLFLTSALFDVVAVTM